MMNLPRTALALSLVLAAACSPAPPPSPEVPAPPIGTGAQGVTTATPQTSTPAPPPPERLSTRDDDVDDLTAAVQRSRRHFDALASSRPSYSYTSSDASFSGFSWTYKLDVSAGKVTARSYKQRDDQGATAKTWTEQASAIGEHDGGPTSDVAALYEHCLTKVLTKDVDKNELFEDVYRDMPPHLIEQREQMRELDRWGDD